jgi:penicillin-binding protein 1A
MLRLGQYKGCYAISALKWREELPNMKATKKNKIIKAKKNKKTKKSYNWLWFFTKYLSLLLLALCILLAAVFWYYSLDLPDVKQIMQIKKQPSITVRAADGVILAKYGDAYGDFLSYEQLPPHLVQAVLATEDRRFFHHYGLDIWGIIRAIYVNNVNQRTMQGASTITQQLAKIAFLSAERTFKRKIQEAILAVKLERNFNKRQILTMYLNRAYFGQGNFGVDAASRYYFGKQLKQLQLYEMAVLAGMLKAPTKYAPTSSKKKALLRAKQVLLNMVDAGYISPQTMRASIPSTFMPRGRQRGALQHPYFADYILEILPHYIGGLHEDITVHTTFDLKVQQKLEKAIYNNLISGRKNVDLQAAGIVLSPNGKIKAMMGGLDYKESQFNRATQAKRQPGSTFKLYVYLAALKAGIKPEDKILDSPLAINGWQPKNFSNQYHGMISVQEAFAKSLNIPAVRLSEKIGRWPVVTMARNLGMEGTFPDVPSIALGVRDTSLLTLTQGYAHVASGGLKVTPYAISKIINNKGSIIYRHKLQVPKRVLDKDVVYAMEKLLHSSITEGTSKAAEIPGRKLFGKTGTSQNFRDAWFVGYDENLITGIWVGFDNQKATVKITGGSKPAAIWRDFMSK